jgi:hypothetical protein
MAHCYSQNELKTVSKAKKNTTEIRAGQQINASVRASSIFSSSRPEVRRDLRLLLKTSLIVVRFPSAKEKIKVLCIKSHICFFSSRLTSTFAFRTTKASTEVATFDKKFRSKVFRLLKIKNKFRKNREKFS